MTQAPLRLGIVGCGRAGFAHAETALHTDRVQLVSTADTDAAARHRAAGEWGVPAYPAVEKMLAGSRLDAVSVCTPPATHPGLVETLLDAGMHVLCEKPGTTGSEALSRLRQTAGARGLALMVSSKFHFVDDLRRAAALLAGGAVGRALVYRVEFCTAGGEPGSWHLERAISGGGVLMDNGTHVYDVLHHLGAGRPVETTALLQDRRTGEEEWRPFGSGYDRTAAYRRQLAAFSRWICAGGEPAGLPDPVTRLRFVETAYRAAREPAWHPAPEAVAAEGPEAVDA